MGVWKRVDDLLRSKKVLKNALEMCVILLQFWSLSFPDALRPPPEPRRRANEIGTRQQCDTALGLNVFEFVDGSEMAVVQHKLPDFAKY
jgi:hypothetical protein